MNDNGLVIGASVKIKKLTGRYAKYLSRPTREGILTAIDLKSVRVKFLHNKKHSPYYSHEHTYYIKDVVVTKHPKNSSIGKQLEALRQNKREVK